MAGYNEIRGLRVKYLSADPANPENGQVWYNSTSGNLRVNGMALAGSWASGGTVPQIVRGGGCGGTQTAAWYAGGLQYPADTKNKTWEYNGSTWTEVNTIPSNFFNGGSTGTLTAGLLAGTAAGYGTNTQVFEYDGTNWVAGGSLSPIGPAYAGGTCLGTQTAAILVGGDGDPPTGVTTAVNYDGSSWTSGVAAPATVNGAAGDGPNTAGWMAGGNGPGMPNTATKEFDGSSWTESGAMGTARGSAQNAGYGPTNAAVFAGAGVPPAGITTAEVYDGTSWAATGSLAVARRYGQSSSQSAGSQTGFVVGGATAPGDNTNATEEFTAPSVITKNLSVS